ncbi:zf-CGNR multi-domain protein [bacterium]|nr:MAG: zf-CGNR multi-domain protein [bacterium]
MSDTKNKDAIPGQLDTLKRFLNTVDLDGGSDELDSPQALGRWLADVGLLDPASEVSRYDAARAVEVREAFRDVIFANTCHTEPDAAALATLSAAGSAARYRVSFHPHEGPQLEACAEGVEGALARLVAIMAQAMLDGSWGRFKACRRDGCRWAFFDWTKNQSGVWCSMAACGNREKARRYQARKRAGGSGSTTV